jgi:hypothetical protein
MVLPSPSSMAIAPIESRTPCPRVWSRRQKTPRRVLVKRPYTDYPDWRFDSARHPLMHQHMRDNEGRKNGLGVKASRERVRVPALPRRAVVGPGEDQPENDEYGDDRRNDKHRVLRHGETSSLTEEHFGSCRERRL